MIYFNASSELLRKAGISSIEKVPIDPQAESLPLSCLSNVQKYVEIKGGGIQFGWIFSCIGNIALKKTAHAVVVREDKTFLCVTPNEYKLDQLNFVRDTSIEKIIKNNFLPTHFTALFKNKYLDLFLDLERELDHLRLTNNGIVLNSEIQEIHNKAAVLYPEILSLAKSKTGGYDYCYCGSTKKRKNCCR